MLDAGAAAAAEATQQLLAHPSAQREAEEAEDQELEVLADCWEGLGLKTVVTLRDDVVALSADLAARGTLPLARFQLNGKYASAAAAAPQGLCVLKLFWRAGWRRAALRCPAAAAAALVTARAVARLAVRR